MLRYDVWKLKGERFKKYIYVWRHSPSHPRLFSHSIVLLWDLMMKFFPQFMAFFYYTIFPLLLLPRKFRYNCFQHFPISVRRRSRESKREISYQFLSFSPSLMSRFSGAFFTHYVLLSKASLSMKNWWKLLSIYSLVVLFFSFYFCITTIIRFSVLFKGEKNEHHTQKKFPRSRMSVKKMLLNRKHFLVHSRASD